MTPQQNKDNTIAAAVTLAAAIIVLLILFLSTLNPLDKEVIAQASIPVYQEEEITFLEPELDLSTPGENNELPEAEEAPLPSGNPEKAPEETTEINIAGKSEKPTPTTPKTVNQTKPSPINKSENRISTEDEKRLRSMNAKFSTTTNGSTEGKTATVNGQGKVNTSGSLYGRKFIGCTTSTIEVSGKITIKVSVKVNEEGHVTYAKAISGPKAYRPTCENWARTARWSAQKGAPQSTGTLTFTITPRS